MDSETKPDSPEGQSKSTLVLLMGRLRPFLIRSWRKASVRARRKTELKGAALDRYMEGFQAGYWTGAVDVSQIRDSDLLPSRKKDPKVH
jgi:hypothetical protein